jgi:hypothetical protein
MELGRSGGDNSIDHGRIIIRLRLNTCSRSAVDDRSICSRCDP